MYKALIAVKVRPLLYLRELADEVDFVLAEAEDSDRERLAVKASSIYSILKEYPVLLVIKNGYVVPEKEPTELKSELRRLGLKPVLRSRERIEGEDGTLFAPAVLLPFTAVIEVVEK